MVCNDGGDSGIFARLYPPIFGLPDEVFVTTVQAIQGKQGYYFDLIRSAGTVSEVVIGLAHPGVSPHPFYILVRDMATTPEGAAIRRLQGTTQAGFSREIPEGYVILGTKEVDIDLRLGTNTPTFSVTRYLFFTTKKGYQVYFPVCLTFDEPAYRKFWEIVATGPEVIGGSELPPFTEEVKQAVEEIMERLYSRYRESIQPTDGWSDLSRRFSQALKEVVGFNLRFVLDFLVAPYAEIKSLSVRNYFTSTEKPHYELISGYLHIKLTHPQKSKDELLDLFKRYVEEGLIVVPNWQ